MPEPDEFTAEEDHAAEPDPGDELQFDQAEYATAAPAGPSCGVCKRPIDDAYFELNGKVVCATCRHRIETALRGGSPLGRAIKALLLGSMAALAGAILYYAIVRVTHLNIGLVAIVVGFMVGAAVRKGSANRGGLFYQLLAVFLTYTAIGLMDFSLQLEAALSGAKDAPEGNPPANVAPQAVEKDGTKAQLPAQAPAAVPDAKGAPLAQADDAGKKAAVGGDRPKTDLAAEERRFKNRPAAYLVSFIALSVFLLYAIPVYHAVQAPISGLIYGFALWEAWRLNRRVHLAFNGPFRVSAPGPDAGMPQEIDDGG
jgi:hypothetical protein